MNMINNIKYAFLPVVMFTMATFTSCEEDIEIGNKIDESSTERIIIGRKYE